MTTATTDATQVERRDLIVDAELRIAGGENGKPARIEGYAAVFNARSEDLGGFREIVLPGAFKESLDRGDDVRGLVDHDPSKIVARRSASTLKLRETRKGLKVEIIPPDTQVGRDIVVSIERGDVDGMSFAFRTISDRWGTEEEEEIRELIKVDLLDVSIVTYPAYPQTEASLRSLKRWKEEQCGLSVNAASRQLRLAEVDMPT